MKVAILITICTIFLISCTKNESDENFEQLNEKFHGNYEMISSVSSTPVDLNMDGFTSTNLLHENSAIINSEIEISIIDENKFLFTEIWPVEYVSSPNGRVVDPISYDSSYWVRYGMFVNFDYFKFADNFNSIHLQGDIIQHEVNTLISFESIIIEEPEIIKVTLMRKLFTINGWVTTKIESRYKRDKI